jgi:ketosteroid isomerase-like protein
VSAREAIAAADADAFEAALAPDVVWVGIRPGWLCRTRDEVMATIRGALDRSAATPEILMENDWALVVDPHLDPPAEQVPDVHHVFVLQDGLVTEIRDYPDRAMALAAVAE